MAVEQHHEDATRQIGPIRRVASLAGGMFAALLVYLLLPDDPGLSDPARATAAIGLLMAIWWLTEALPLPVTSLMPIILFPLAGVMSIGEATAPYASDIIFLFMGGFMLALAMQRSGLHRRIALHIVLLVGTQAIRLVGGFMLATAFLSMWISNTATAVMMLPIGLSIILLVDQSVRPTGDAQSFEELHPNTRSFAAGLMLSIAYAASIGTLSTPISTAPNLFLLGYLENTFGIGIDFGQWMLFGLPVTAVMLLLTWLVLTRVFFRPAFSEITGGRQLVERELAELGPVSRNERLVLTIFGGTALAWIFREPVTSWDWLVNQVPWIERLTDSGIAVIAALLLFAIPYDFKSGETSLDWDTAVTLPWGVLLLFGGGLSLANAVQSSGLDLWTGEQLDILADLPVVVVMIGSTLLVTSITELMSNTATAATFLPILGGFAIAHDIDPLVLLMPATFVASSTYMLPVATPPNAIVFGSGYITIRQMATTGLMLNVISLIVITLAMILWAPIVLGVEF